MFSQHHNDKAVMSCVRTSEVAQREVRRTRLSREERASRVRQYAVRAALGQDLFDEVQRGDVV